MAHRCQHPQTYRRLRSTSAAQRQTAGPAIIAKLQDANSQLETLEKSLSNSKDSYAAVTTEVVKTLHDEATVYIAYAQKAQVEDPGSDPEFMTVVKKLEPTAQVRVQAVQKAGEAYDKLPNKEGLTRLKPLL